MSRNAKIGLCILLLGVGMFLLGASLFSYSGPALNPLVSEAGMWAFILWLPTIIIGIVFMVIPSKKR